MLSASERSDIVATAQEMAEVSRKAILRHFRAASLAVDNKQAAGFDPVTQADRASETAMRELLSRRRPGDGILGEEFGEAAGESGFTWVLDPIDGTRGFLAGTPTWGVLIAFSDSGGPRYGVIDQPYIGERFAGGLGEAWFTGPHGGGPLAVRGDRPLGEAILFTTSPGIGTEAEARAFGRLAARTRLTRYGMDCYAFALLALGQVDLVVEAGLQPYDIHAPIAVIEAAGGIVTDWQGGPAARGGRVVAAAGPALHAAALEELSTAPPP